MEPAKDREPEKELFSWVAPSRPFKTRSREYFVTLFAITGLIGLILFIAEGPMPVVLLIAIVFLFYVLSTVQPDQITYKITNKGVRVAEKLTEWNLLGRFWFNRRFDSSVLTIETAILPGRLELVIKVEDEEEIKKTLSAYLTYEEVKPTGVEKVANWVSGKLPGNKV